MLPWNAAALPEIMAGAVQESKLDVPVLFHEGRAAGQQTGSAAGGRGSRAPKAKARPNVEVNRRAEGTSELNRRLGAVGNVRGGFCVTAARRRLTDVKRPSACGWSLLSDLLCGLFRQLAQATREVPH